MNHRFCPKCRRSFDVLARCPADHTPLEPIPTTYPAPGATIDGAYQLLAPFAEGGMSRIYRAQGVGRAGPVAVKVLDPALAAEPHIVERFLREARMSQLLDHPNLVEVYDFGVTSSGHHVIAMEFLGGESLGDLISRVGALPWMRAMHIAIELLDTLGHAHGRRVVHRDLKPDNVQLFGDPGPNERVKLLDFGVAYVAADATFSVPAPGSGGVSGTPAYMSPEQIRGAPIDGRSDMYALGMLLYQMLSGVLPFDAPDAVSMCRLQLTERPPPLAPLVAPDVPTPLVRMTMDMIQKNRGSRPPSVGALLQVAQRILPKESWPTRLLRPYRSKPRREGQGGAAACLHGLPRDNLLAQGRRASVAILHVEFIEDDQSAFFPTDPHPRVAGLTDLWCRLAERERAFVQRPDPRAARVLVGLFDLGAEASVKALTAARLAGSLAEMARRLRQDEGLDISVRCGLVLKQFESTSMSRGPAYLTDADADLAFLLARESGPGEVTAEASAAFSLRPAFDIDSRGNLTGAGLRAPVPMWRVTAAEDAA